jgi:hypothetical protein
MELDFNTATIRGHRAKGKEKNPIWVEDRVYKMYCEKDTICMLCPDGYNKILEFEKEFNDNKKITWFRHKNGNINGTFKNTKVVMHHIVLGLYNSDSKRKPVVEFIDKNILNIAINNLKITSQFSKQSEKNAEQFDINEYEITEDQLEIIKDNEKHLERFKENKPHASYIAGFIDGDGCIFIRKIKNGYQTGLSISQSRTNILQVMKYHFGGSITAISTRCNKTKDDIDNEKYSKYNIRNEYNYFVRSGEYSVLLDYIKDAMIIKKNRIDCLYKYNFLVNKINKNKEKEELYKLCSEYNKNHVMSEGVININIEYIAGLFDAEGCVYINKDTFNYCISIAQKSYPIILKKINEYLGFGNIYKKSDINKEKINNSITINGRDNCLKFIASVKDHCIIKYNQLCALEIILNTKDENIKQEMYNLSNKEKHKSELFTGVNQSNENKDEYFKTLELMKETEKNKINLKENKETINENKEIKIRKERTDEHKEKIGKGISKTRRENSRFDLSDENILRIREMLNSGMKNIDIIKFEESQGRTINRYVVSDIKNNKIVLTSEDKPEIERKSQTELAISKKKITPEETIFILERIIDNESNKNILNQLKENNKETKASIDIIKNIKRNIGKNKEILYETETTPEIYQHHNELIGRIK